VIHLETKSGQSAGFIPGNDESNTSALPTPEELAAEFPEPDGDWKPIIDFLEGNDLPPVFGLDALTVPVEPIQHTMEGSVKVAELVGLLTPGGSRLEVTSHQDASKDFTLDGSAEPEPIADSLDRQGVKVETGPVETVKSDGGM